MFPPSGRFNQGSPPPSNPFQGSPQQSNPFQDLSPSQSLSSPFNQDPYVTVNVNWTFACNHSFTQKKSERRDKPPLPALLRSKYSSQKFPECVEKEGRKYKEEEEAAHAKEETAWKLKKEARKQRELLWEQEEAARLQEDEARVKEEKARQKAAKEAQHEREALEVYKSQAANFHKLIEDAGDNVALRNNLEKLLENCKLLWADMVKKTEKARSTASGTINSAAMMDMMEKIELMTKRAEILLDRARAKPSSSSNLEDGPKLDRQLKKWRTITKSMKTAIDTFNTKVAEHL
jgi:chemotaxis protein histidine kinase CheA